jgi:hypothetical protein
MRNGLWKKEIVVGIIILFIGTSVLPSIKGDFEIGKNLVVNQKNPNKNLVPLDQLDQYQIVDDMGFGCITYYYAQSFKPTLTTLTRIFLLLYMITNDSGNPDFQISIRKDISGSDLTSCYLDSSEVNNGIDWYECDFPDIDVTPEDTYYIVVHEICSDWCIGLRGHINQGMEDVYSRGDGYAGDGTNWVKDPNCDYCFKTYGGSAENQLIAEAGGPYLGNVNQNIQFTGGASGGTSPYQYRWDWTNDGTYDTSYSTSNTAFHRYPSQGTYTLKLQVRDNIGATTTDTASVTVTSKLVPEAGGPYFGTVDQSIQFIGNASGGTSPYQYRWDWTNDGTYDTNYSISPIASHSYSSEGPCTVKLQVKDNSNSTATDTAQVTIKSENQFIISITGVFGVSAIIRNTGTAAMNVPWWISVSGGIIFTRSHFSGTINELAVNDTTTIKSSGLWGIGSITITVQVDDVTKDATAFLLGPLVLGVKQQ